MIKFGVAGFPLAFTNGTNGKDRSKIFAWLQELRLDALELQMTYGPRTKPEKCKLYKQLADDHGIRLSVHAAYYIVLTSDDSEKVQRSFETLKKTYELADILGAKEIVLHPGPLYGEDAIDVHDRFADNAQEFMNQIGTSEIGLFIETAGKLGQLGSVDEILSLSSQIDGVHPCVDFGHVHARTLGSLETPRSIESLVGKIHKFLSAQPDKRIHFHYTPIHFGPKGEIKHRAVADRYPEPQQSDMFGGTRIGEYSVDGLYHPRPEPVASALASLDTQFTIISETHNSQEIGAQHLKDCIGQ
ncbi:TIM barrel protein [uncultured Cohaesibacter sp.]|uniref:TIM barrel protein n=1 Tax=uncultured Cohaesibacter sp. TaxID=1002546 RepID=UPI002AA89A8E|nr:TIM barrel protein [uncultured Cohaesibacter sp.]